MGRLGSLNNISGSSSVVERNVANVLVLGSYPARNLNNLTSKPYWDAMWDAVGLIWHLFIAIFIDKIT